ncbi:hypothetical protein A2524_02020 [Candidatus Wolfebacteria bacterium RIFOXYD12_FULL_48_21]|nr:MAG: hypothetical protein A2524_02020 [Candidatus Wolfebacteria bacterium RIFOXYD12_FULL_48_21]
MISQKLIKEIIEEAVHAPSGDNSQPWRFEVRGNEIDIYNLVGRDATLFNFKNRGDFLAHGALIENIAIAAAHFGYKAEMVLFPEVGRNDHTATVRLEKAVEKKETGLFKAIRERATNRKIYQSYVLTEEEKEYIEGMKGEGGAEIRLVDNREDVNKLATIVSLNERLLLENKHIHDFLFSIIRWTDEEEKGKPGMHVKTLELAPPQRFAFRRFKSWKFVECANRIGASKFIAKENAKVYASSSAIGAIIMESDAPKDFMQAGRLLEHMWLTLTNRGLSLQPVTAVAYLAQRIKAGDVSELSAEHQELIKRADKETREILGIGDKTIAMVFRIGKADKPSGRAFKLGPDIRWSV